MSAAVAAAAAAASAAAGVGGEDCYDDDDDDNNDNHKNTDSKMKQQQQQEDTFRRHFLDHHQQQSTGKSAEADHSSIDRTPEVNVKTEAGGGKQAPSPLATQHHPQDEILATLQEFYVKGLDQAQVLQEQFRTTMVPRLKQRVEATVTQVRVVVHEHEALLEDPKVLAGAVVVVSLFVLFLGRCLFFRGKRQTANGSRSLVTLTSVSGGKGNSNQHLNSSTQSNRSRNSTDHRLSVPSRENSENRDRLNTEDDSHSRRDSFYSQHGGRRLSANSNGKFVPKIRGPQVPALLYHTWTPPTPWSDASKKLLPTTTTATNVKMLTKSKVAEVTLVLDLSQGKLHNRIEHESKQHGHHHHHHHHRENQGGVPLTDIRLRVQHTVGAVLEIFLNAKGSTANHGGNNMADSGTTKMEHTFESAQEAAQFQHDLIAFQIVGKAIQNMYHSLELIHRGSEAHEGKESLLHDAVGDDEITLAAVAWDDVYRCLGTFPKIRASLEESLLNTSAALSSSSTEAAVTATPAPKGTRAVTQPDVDIDDQVLASVAPQYQNKRNMLGHVDLFRLFVPPLPPGCSPQPESSPQRLGPWIALRKEVATVSLYVQAYVRAKCVVNKGWQMPSLSSVTAGGGLDQSSNEDETNTSYDAMARRLTFDEDRLNMKHDANAKHEYYEPIVSKDVLCEIKAKERDGRNVSMPSDVQAYALVGSRILRLPPRGEDEDHPLDFDRDPIEAIPSLRRIVESNPDLDFFCIGFFPEGPRVAMIHLFVRTLPKGVDLAFDKTVRRFAEATPKVRDRKLAVFLQLGPGGGLSPMVWAGIKAVSTLLSWTRGGDQHIPVESGGERTQFPGILMDNYMEMSHFGGLVNIATSSDLPNNYIAATAHCDAKQMRNMVFRILYQRLEDGALPASVVDFSFVLEGDEEDEVPERVLGSVRLVHCDPINRALPIELTAMLPEEEEPVHTGMSEHLQVVTSPKSIMASIPLPGILSSRSKQKTPVVRAPLSPQIKVAANTPFDTAWGFFGHKNHTSHGPTSGQKEETKEEEDMVAPVSRTASLLNVIPDDENPYRAGIDSLIAVLGGVQVPVRKAGLLESQKYVSAPLTEHQIAILPHGSMKNEEFVNLDVLETLNRDDLGRFYAAADCKLKEAAIKLVESTAWRGRMFPVDTRTCRIELQSGQFFQQGEDRMGNPVFYFRNMCVGPWRQDANAVINAMLHRFETSLTQLSQKRPGTKVTLIVLLGKPHFAKKNKRKKPKKKERADDETKTMTTGGNDDDDDDYEDDATTATESTMSWNPFKMGVNPRLNQGEDYHVHTNQTMIRKLIQILMDNYPERLHKAIFVPGNSRGYGYWSTAVGVQIAIRNNVKSPRTRARCFILHRISELKEFVHPSQIISIVGGEAVLDESAFQCT